MKTKKKFTEQFQYDKSKQDLSINFILLNGNETKELSESNTILKAATCEKLNSSNYECVRFYKKISKF